MSEKAAKKAWEMSFHEWVLRRYTKRNGGYSDCPGGDLAQDFAKDTWFNEDENEDADILDINEHMLHMRAPWQAIRTLYECYDIYNRQVMAEFGLNENGYPVGVK